VKQPIAFTQNKQVVRDLQFDTVRRRLSARIGSLTYFGLPSDGMQDVIQWDPFLGSVVAVERGESGREWEVQYSLMATAFERGLLGKTTLLRGDIDLIMLNGQDVSGRAVPYPFDIVTLDYSGGVFYRDEHGALARIEAIKKLIECQAKHGRDYVLFISANLDNVDDAEVSRTLANVATDLNRAGMNGSDVIDAYLSSKHQQARMKLYVPYLVSQTSARLNYGCETEQAVFYRGNRDMIMTNFRFYLKPDLRTAAPRSPRERLWQVVNAPMIEIRNGRIRRASLRLPLTRRQNETPHA
jgi:hypothetical protein